MTAAEECNMWRKRALESADLNQALNSKLNKCKTALEQIVHMGYVGDKHVDLAHKTLNEIR